MTVPGTCQSGHAILPGELYCPACGEYLGVGPDPRQVDPTAAYPGPPFGGYDEPAYAGHPPNAGPASGPYGYYAPYFPLPFASPRAVPWRSRSSYVRPLSTPGAPGAPAYYAPPRPANGFAVASFVLGLCWFAWIGSVLAVIFGHVALRESRRRGEPSSILALAGVALGWIGIASLMIVLVLRSAPY